MKLPTFPLSRLAVAAVFASGAALAQTAPVADVASAPPAARAGAPRPPAPDRAAPDAVPTTTLTGRVARWLPNPNGEVDGLLLEDGTQVNFPPHLSSRVLTAVKLQDSVLVTGRAGPAQAGAKVVRATLIRSSASGQTVGDEAPAGGPPRAPRDHAALTAMKEGGKISALLRTGRGDVNGVVLASGTVVRFPPHAGAQFSSLLQSSGTLYAEGYGTRNAQGSAFEATQIGASASALQTVFPGPRGPAGGPAGPGAKPPAPGGERARPSVEGPMPPAPRDGAAPPAPRDDAAPPAPRDSAASPALRGGALPPPPRDGATSPAPRSAASAPR